MTDTTEERLRRVEKTLAELDSIILGDWDLKTAKRMPGLIENISKMGDQLTLIVNILKWGIGPLITLCTLSQVGAKELIPIIGKIFLEISGIH
jgi:hypothetical protein